MRALKTKDIFTVSRILKKMKIKPEVNQDTTQAQLGVELMIQFVQNLGEAEEEVSAFFADLKGITPAEFAELDLEETAEIINEFKQLKGLNAFLSQAFKSTT
jgi:hypothetical protein